MLHKNRISIILLLALLIASLCFYLSKRNQTFDKKESQFAIQDTSDISRIDIFHKNSLIILHKGNGTWQFDDSLNANPALMKICLRILTQVEIKSVVAKDLQSIMYDKIKKSGSEVKVFKGNQLIRDYSVFPDSVNRAIYMMMSDSRHPFIVDLPSFEGNFAGLFQTDVKLWRDKAIMRFLPKQLAYIKVEQVAKPSQSFELKMDGSGKATVKSLQTHQSVNFNVEAVEAYLYCFRNVRVEEFLSPEVIRGETLLFIVQIADIRGKLLNIKIYQKNDSLKTNQTGVHQVDMNLCHVLINDREVASIKYVETDPITRDLDFFEK
jgi:hypothetical protein